MYRLENEHLAITVAPHGAELQSLVSGGHEYLWQGEPRYWKRRAPVLFPIVGKLKNGHYRYCDHKYQLPEHGFAHNQDFSLIGYNENSLRFRLEDSGASGEHYPFAFILDLGYSLRGDTLRVDWRVENPCQEQELLFSIGASPAFNLPLTTGACIEDHHIQLEGSDISRLNCQDGLLDSALQPAEAHIPLNHDLFAAGGLIYHTPNSTAVHLRGGTNGITLRYSGLPYLGLWTPAGKRAPFLCIEPWAGVTDTAEHDGELENKLGIQRLAPQNEWQRHYNIQIQRGA